MTRLKTDPKGLVTPEVYENIPVSLKNFEISKELDEGLRFATKQQSELWAKISGDWEWQYEQIKG